MLLLVHGVPVHGAFNLDTAVFKDLNVVLLGLSEHITTLHAARSDWGHSTTKDIHKVIVRLCWGSLNGLGRSTRAAKNVHKSIIIDRLGDLLRWLARHSSTKNVIKPSAKLHRWCLLLWRIASIRGNCNQLI